MMIAPPLSRSRIENLFVLQRSYINLQYGAAV